MSGKILHCGDIFTWPRDIFFLLLADLREKVTLVEGSPKKRSYFRRWIHSVSDYVDEALYSNLGYNRVRPRLSH